MVSLSKPGLKLTEEDKQVLFLSEEVLNESITKGALHLLALIIADKGVNKEAFKLTMSNIWKPKLMMVYFQRS